MKHPPLVWIGVTLAATGLGTGKRGLLYIGLALLAVGLIGKERILQELPPDVRRQISDALQVSAALPPTVPTFGAPGFEPVPSPADLPTFFFFPEE